MDISKITAYYFCIQENVYWNMWKYFFLPPQVIYSIQILFSQIIRINWQNRNSI